MKKIVSFIIMATMFSAYVSPVLAIQNNQPETNNIAVKATKTKEKNKTKKVKKTKGIKKTAVQPSQNKYEYVNLEWWKGFNDEHLNNYIVKAIENNKDLKMATLTIDEYYQAVKAQRGEELPSIQAGFSPAYKKFMGQTGGAFALPIIASYELDIWGKNHNKTTAVKKLYEASILDEQAAYITIAAAVGTVYINIVKLDAMIDIQTQIVDLRKNIFEIMDLSNREGLTSTADLVKANKSYIVGVSSLTELKKNRAKMLHQLAVLIGDSPENIEGYSRMDYHNLSFNGVMPEYVSSEVIMQRPDYLKAEKMMEKAGIDVRIARKEMCPSVMLGGLMVFNNTHLESLFTTSNMIWAVGGSLMQPIFMGGRLVANLKAKKIAYERSLKNYEKVNLTSVQEVNDSLVSVNMDKLKLAKQQEIQNLEIKDFELSNAQYNEGVISKLDLYQRQENLLSVNEAVYNTKFDCMIDTISYYKSTAGAKTF